MSGDGHQAFTWNSRRDLASLIFIASIAINNLPSPARYPHEITTSPIRWMILDAYHQTGAFPNTDAYSSRGGPCGMSQPLTRHAAEEEDDRELHLEQRFNAFTL